MRSTLFSRGRFFLACFCAAFVASSAGAQSAGDRPLSAPKLPRETFAYWHSGKVLQKKGELTVVDVVGTNHVSVAAPWLSMASGGGLSFDGTQPEGIRLAAKQPVANRFIMGVDVRVDAEGPEHQTIAYLYRFAEFRYRRSRAELTLNVWQSLPDESGKELVTSTVLPLPPGKWARVRATIEDKVARLEIDSAKAESRLAGSWEFLPPTVVFLIGKGGTDRSFRGQLDHLYLAFGE